MCSQIGEVTIWNLKARQNELKVHLLFANRMTFSFRGLIWLLNQACLSLALYLSSPPSASFGILNYKVFYICYVSNNTYNSGILEVCLLKFTLCSNKLCVPSPFYILYHFKMFLNITSYKFVLKNIGFLLHGLLPRYNSQKQFFYG